MLWMQLLMRLRLLLLLRWLELLFLHRFHRLLRWLIYVQGMDFDKILGILWKNGIIK